MLTTQYTYYSLTALSIRVPTPIKRSLTTMQITQFVFGTTMAASYLFVHYTLPYTVKDATSAGVLPWLKKVTGSEDSEKPIVPDTESRMTTCMDTTGQAFAIWLNVMYLLPLTYLFVRFFVRSYLSRKDPGTPQPTHMHAAEKAGMDALMRVSREIQKSVEMNGEVSEATDDEVVQGHLQKGQAAANGSPRKTRSTSKRNANGTANGHAGSDESSSGSSGKKKGKKAAKEAAPSVPEAKGQNRFEVLNGHS